MSKTSKRVISILVIAILALSFVLPLVGVSAALQVPFVAPGSGQYGDVITVTGSMGDAVGGATMEIYWDTAIGEDAYLLNSTTAESDGNWEVNFDVPEALAGDHFVWVKDTSGPFYESSIAFTVDPLVEVTPSSGLSGDDVDVDGYGFGDETVVAIQIDPWSVAPEIIDTGDAAQVTFTGTLDYAPIDPTTVSITDTVEIFTDPAGLGVLVGSLTGTGTIVYATGVYSITFNTAPAAAQDITANYDIEYIIEDSSSYECSDVGSFTKTFTVPDFPYGTFTITAADDDAPVNTDFETFEVGASISITPEEGPTGTVIAVDGRGWTVNEDMSFTYDGNPAEVVDAAVITVGSTGKFSADVVIPGMTSTGEYSFTASETGPLPAASVDFEVDGVQEIKVSPTYGSPGATINVYGYNFTQVSGTEVAITLYDGVTKIEDLVIAETESDGTFEDTFLSPAVPFIGYDVQADDAVYHMYAEDPFKVGLIAMIINPTSGEAGTEVSLTGIGFKGPGDYNLTFGDVLYEDYGSGVSGGEAISDIFYAPNLEPGTYDVTVIDEDENELTAHFTVIAMTGVDLDPAMAPNDYNMTIEGYNFAEYVFDVEFILYNATDEWDMDVWQNAAGNDPVETDDDGNFTAWWMVLLEADLSLGDYTINATGYDDFLVQIPFSVVEPRVEVAPRKALFDRGDTIQFNVANDFDFQLSYMKVWDPYDNLYWKTETFSAWLKVGDLYTVPYYLQTSGMNPMTLPQDAPMGTWFWVFYEEGTTQLVNGTFEVGPSTAAQVDEKLTELWGSVEELTTNIDNITDEIADDIDALSGEIDDVVADVQDMVDDITSDLAGELAQVAQDTEAAVGELEDSIGDIAQAQNDLASDLDAVSADTTAAREAAEDAQTAASGLTTLVYGAIAASLIAALAAIVSLMQISKKIA